MLEYLAQNFGYILVAGVLLLIVAAIILRMVRNRRAGKGAPRTQCAELLVDVPGQPVRQCRCRRHP